MIIFNEGLAQALSGSKFHRSRGVTCILQNVWCFGPITTRDVEYCTNTGCFCCPLMVEAGCSLQSETVLIYVLGTIGYKVSKGFTRNEETGQCSMQLVKADFEGMAY